jgi:hypothetical protein
VPPPLNLSGKRSIYRPAELSNGLGIRSGFLSLYPSCARVPPERKVLMRQQSDEFLEQYEDPLLLVLIRGLFRGIVINPLWAASFIGMIMFWLSWWWMYPPSADLPLFFLVLYGVGLGSTALFGILHGLDYEMSDSKLVTGTFVLGIYIAIALEEGYADSFMSFVT